MNWQEEYRRKLVSAQEAVKVIKSGDKVVLPMGSNPVVLGLALTGRMPELRDLEIYFVGPLSDFGWFDNWVVNAHTIVVGFPAKSAPGADLMRQAIQEKRVDDLICPLSCYLKSYLGGRPGVRQADVVMVNVSPPDANGFCSFGSSLWDQKQQAENAKVVLAEVDKRLIRTYGDNFIHVSQIDYLTETDLDKRAAFTNLPPVPVTREVEAIAGYLAILIKDGDTIEAGLSDVIEAAVAMPGGPFDNKHDLGWHTERLPRGGR